MSNANFSPLNLSDQEKLLTPAEVASLFRVDPKTVTRWAKSGKLTSIRTLGGHRRYKQSEVRSLLKSIESSKAQNIQKLDGKL
jgi:excisionase family DNA binding protein